MSPGKDDVRCSARIFSDFGNRQCSRRGKVQEGGKWYCHQHRPSAVKARCKASWERHDAKRQARHDARDAAEKRLIDAATVDLSDELAQEQEKNRRLGAENERLRADSHFWSEEAGFLRRELTKINNIIQPLWGDLRVLREEAGRDPQTGEAAAQQARKEKP